MSDLTDFLLARIAEDEAVAREANGRVAWLTLRKPDGSMRYTTVAHQHHSDEAGWFADGHEIDAQHVSVFYDSARVLAECAAKRQVVEDYEYAAKDYRVSRSPLGEGRRFAALMAVARMAAVYSNHADYRDDFRP